MRIRLDLGYDGTDFHGWASQPGLRTVQGELEAAIARIIRGEEPKLTVGGRTDAGVHARGQVAHIDLSQKSAELLTVHRINSLLRRNAPDIVVHSVREVPDVFDARFGALSRRYEYRLRDASSRVDPLTTRYTTQVPGILDLQRMQEASEQLLGLQDFTTFCKSREGATAIRTLLTFHWQRAADGALVASVAADAFCHSMVRALVGSVVAVGKGRLTVDELNGLRDARERSNRFSVMPAHGLSLEEIVYPSDTELATRAEQTRARRSAHDVVE